jgi:hypothetical protein
MQLCDWLQLMYSTLQTQQQMQQLQHIRTQIAARAHYTLAGSWIGQFESSSWVQQLGVPQAELRLAETCAALSAVLGSQ